MQKYLTSQDVVTILRQQQGERTSKAFAVEIGVSESRLSEIYNGVRSPNVDVIMKYLGLRKMELYEKIS